jgi:hypothetical protein
MEKLKFTEFQRSFSGLGLRILAGIDTRQKGVPTVCRLLSYMV